MTQKQCADTALVHLASYEKSKLSRCSCLSNLQKSSCLKELQRLLYRVIKAVVASPGQVSSNQTHRDHQPPGSRKEDRVTLQKCYFFNKWWFYQVSGSLVSNWRKFSAKNNPVWGSILKNYNANMSLVVELSRFWLGLEHAQVSNNTKVLKSHSWHFQ